MLDDALNWQPVVVFEDGGGVVITPGASHQPGGSGSDALKMLHGLTQRFHINCSARLTRFLRLDKVTLISQDGAIYSILITLHINSGEVNGSHR